MWYEVAQRSRTPHQRPLHSGLEAEIPAEFDIYRTFPAKKPKKGLGWFFPPAVRGEMGNGTSQFLPRSRRLLGANPPVLLAQVHTNISRVKTTTVRVSVYEEWARLLSARPFSSRGTIGRCLDTDRGGGHSPDPHLSRHLPAVENGI